MGVVLSLFKSERVWRLCMVITITILTHGMSSILQKALLTTFLWFRHNAKAQYTDSGSYPICYVCGSENQRVSTPTATVMFPTGLIPLGFMDIPDITCGAIEEIGLLGQLPSFICDALQTFPLFQIPCDCAEKSIDSSYPTANPTIAKTGSPSVLDTSFPTTSAPLAAPLRMDRPTLLPTVFLRMPIQISVAVPVNQVPSSAPSISVFPTTSPVAKIDLDIPTAPTIDRDFPSPIPSEASQRTFPPREPDNSPTVVMASPFSPAVTTEEPSSSPSGQYVSQPSIEYLSLYPSDSPSLTPSSQPSEQPSSQPSLPPTHPPSFRPRETQPGPSPNISTPGMNQDGSNLGEDTASESASCSMAFSFALQFCSPVAEEVTLVYHDICNVLRHTCGVQEDRLDKPTTSPTPAPVLQPQKCGLVGRASTIVCDPQGDDILSVLRAYCQWMRTTCSNDP